MQQTRKIAVIGAGIGGLSFVRQHLALNPQANITIFEKSRSVGGRLATRRIEKDNQNLSFDHGAQYFTISSGSPFEKFVQDAKIAQEWKANIVSLDEQGVIQPLSNTLIKRFVAVPSQSSLVKQLFQLCNQEKLKVYYETRIEKISHDGKSWKLISTKNDEYDAFDTLVLNIPAEQAMQLIKNSNLPYESLLEPFSMNPCWAFMIAFKKPLQAKFDAAFVNKKCAFSWIANNSTKPGRKNTQECWVAHATNEWTKQHLNLPAEQIEVLLRQEFVELIKPYLNSTEDIEPSTVAAHRWLYSIPAKGNESSEPYLIDEQKNIGFCGDWCAKGKVEGAFHSGYYLATKL